MAAKKKKGPGRPPTRVGKLAKWIESSGMTRTKVAEKLGISRQYLDQFCREERRPSLKIAMEIERITDKKVSASYLSGLPKKAAT
jgi:transcriptional regulator with XRE-family HTH domain